MKILFLPKYDTLGASSRYRIYQYIRLFEKNNIKCTILPMFSNNYIRSLESNKRVKKAFYTFAGVIRRIFQLLKISSYDYIYIEKELLPYFPPIFEWLLFKFKIKYILDYDDAIFEYYNHGRTFYHKIFLKDKIPYIVGKASAVITGSPYLTEFCSHYNDNVHEIPTSIDFDKYEICSEYSSKFVIGWIGGRASSIHLAAIIDTLIKFINMHDDVYLNLIGFNSELLNQEIINNKKVKIIPWDDATEIYQLNKLSCGIMPLKKTLIADGKCGFKLIQYMACAKPTISSPFEANLKIGKENNNLFASSENEWIESLESIYKNKEKYKEIGARNRKTVFEKYSIQSNVKQYINILESLS